jgi:hypothetical protein
MSSLPYSGVEVKVEGFTHRLPVLAQRIFAALAKGTFPKAAFDSVKEALQRKYRNTGMQVRERGLGVGWSGNDTGRRGCVIAVQVPAVQD